MSKRYGDYPERIQKKIKENVESSGGKYDQNTRFDSSDSTIGFIWRESIESKILSQINSSITGDDFWNLVLEDYDYSVFDQLYPDKKYINKVLEKSNTIVYEAVVGNRKAKITIEYENTDKKE